MELHDLKTLHDKAFEHGEVTRRQAADDIIFADVTQWDDNLLDASQLQYRGEFDVIRKAIRQIVAQMKANPVQVDFKPKDESRDDGAEILDGIYRTEDGRNTSIEAYDNASTEAVKCGYGAWLLYNDYEASAIGNTNQMIKRRPLYEANNKVFWDPNAKLLDKSDARYVSVLTAYSPDGYRDLVKELTGEELTNEELADCTSTPDIQGTSFGSPEQSYTFPWFSQSNVYYVGEMYIRSKVPCKVYFMESPMGEELILRDSDIEEIKDELADGGYKIIDEKKVERYQVKKFIVSGDKILSEDVIPGEHIPVVPVYGERAFAEDEEHYEGIVRRAKDAQRLRNFQLSYLADIVSRSPREKVIYTPEQIQGFEHMYDENGADNNYPYLLQHRTSPTGEALPLGPVGMSPAPNIPPALAQSVDLTRAAIEDVANPGLPQNIADPDASGKAIYALQNRLDQQTAIYQTNFKHAKRRDGEIFASMAAQVYDSPRKVTLTKPDGTTTQASMMEAVIDRETGEPVVLNDLTNMEFDVLADVGPAFTTQKEQTLDQLQRLMAEIPPGDPIRDAIMLKYIQLIDGIQLDDIREYSNKQSILKGYKEPETEEEMAFAQQIAQQQAQQAQQPSPEMLLGQAEMIKAQAQAQGEINDANKLGIDQFNAETKRMELDLKAQVEGIKMANTQSDTESKQIDNAMKLRNPVLSNINLRQSVN